MYRYHAFGFTIKSEFELPHIPIEEQDLPEDIIIRKGNLSQSGIITDDESALYTYNECHYGVENIGLFRITNGNLIEAEPLKDLPASEFAVYLMGSCMGAIIHQRGLLPLHGSCVTNGEKSVLITGWSGAGKSTMAAEFIKHGWKILTDDVCIIKNIDNLPVAQSSYPSQKLWQDSLLNYHEDMDDPHINHLYHENKRDKYGVNVSDHYQDGTAPLSLIVRLIPHEQVITNIYPVDQYPKIEQIRKNTYRKYMIDKSHRQNHFQQCVTLSLKVPMILALRQKDTASAPILYDKICHYLEDPENYFNKNEENNNE